MKTYSSYAFAKINLSLDILGKRSDGYHSVKMIMQEIPLYDKVTLTLEKDNGIRLSCNDSTVPTDERNTVYQAVKLFLGKTNIHTGVSVNIEKNIPAAAGMAGGSTDAAATLKILNQAFDYPLSDEEILKLCLKIGADVPFCYLGGCALSEGIGEILTPVSPLKNACLVIAKPQFSVSTKWVYENFKPDDVEKHPDTEAVIKAIADGDLTMLKLYSANVLETVTEVHYPIITEYKNLLNKEGAVFSMMSGSGPTVFGLFDDEASAYSAYDLLKKLTPDSFILKI